MDYKNNDMYSDIFTIPLYCTTYKDDHDIQKKCTALRDLNTQMQKRNKEISLSKRLLSKVNNSISINDRIVELQKKILT